MALESDLTALFLDTVTIEPFTGRDEYGKPTFGASASYKCRVQNMGRAERDKEGAYSTNWATVIMDYTSGLNTEDRITLPDGTQPMIDEIVSAPDDKGPYYTEIRCLPKRA